MRCGALGRVDRVRLRHDNSGIGPAWFVDWVEIREEGEKGDGEGVCVWVGKMSALGKCEK